MGVSFVRLIKHFTRWMVYAQRVRGKKRVIKKLTIRLEWMLSGIHKANFAGLWHFKTTRYVHVSLPPPPGPWRHQPRRGMVIKLIIYFTSMAICHGRGCDKRNKSIISFLDGKINLKIDMGMFIFFLFLFPHSTRQFFFIHHPNYMYFFRLYLVLKTFP